MIEAVEVRTEDTIYLVKVSTKLADRIENYDEDDEIEIEPIADIALDDDDDAPSDDDDDKPEYKDDDVSGEDDDEDEDDADDSDIAEDEDDEDEE